MKLHSINKAQRLYRVACGTGTSSCGFDALDKRARAVAEWLRDNEAGTGQHIDVARRFLQATGADGAGPSAVPGEPAHFGLCAAVLDAGARYAAATGKQCPAELVPQFIGLEGKRVEVHYPVPDGGTVRERFYIGKSAGWLPVHLALKTRRSTGGLPARLPPDASFAVIG